MLSHIAAWDLFMYLTCITITQSTIITSPIGFNIGLTNVDASLKQPTLRNVVSTLFQSRTLTLYQLCAMLKIRHQILFHFQLRINVISMLIHNVETTLIRSWNVGWVGSERWTLDADHWRLILRTALILCSQSWRVSQRRNDTLIILQTKNRVDSFFITGKYHTHKETNHNEPFKSAVKKSYSLGQNSPKNNNCDAFS